MLVQIFHNENLRSALVEGYLPGDSLLAQGAVDVIGTTPSEILEAAFAATNCGSGQEDPGYMALNVRSTSKGDVFVLDGVAYAVASYGFTQIQVNPLQVVG